MYLKRSNNNLTSFCLHRKRNHSVSASYMQPLDLLCRKPTYPRDKHFPNLFVQWPKSKSLSAKVRSPNESRLWAPPLVSKTPDHNHIQFDLLCGLFLLCPCLGLVQVLIEANTWHDAHYRLYLETHLETMIKTGRSTATQKVYPTALFLPPILSPPGYMVADSDRRPPESTVDLL